MNLSLLLPAALGALIALAIPLLIHLARREQQQPTVFAALRWLRERPKPRRRIRFDEWPLLLLRLLLLALLALWLACPVLLDSPDRTPWTLVAPGVANEDIQRVLEGAEGEVRWLATGFPPLTSPMPTAPQATASLLRQVDAQLSQAAGLTVVVPEQLAGMDGAPMNLSREVDWQVVPGASPLSAAMQDASPPLVVRHGGGQDDAVRILRAAMWALHEDAVDADLDVAPASVALPATAQRVAWFVPGAMPQALLHWIEQGGEALLASEVDVAMLDHALRVAWRDENGNALVESAAMGQGRILRFTRPLQPAAMPQVLDASFPARLQALFDVSPLPSRRPAEIATPRATLPSWTQSPRDLQPWLALLIALLVLVERWLATSARRGERS